MLFLDTFHGLLHSLGPLSDNGDVQDTEDEEMKMDVETETKGKGLAAHDEYTSIAL